MTTMRMPRLPFRPAPWTVLLLPLVLIPACRTDPPPTRPESRDGPHGSPPGTILPVQVLYWDEAEDLFGGPQRWTWVQAGPAGGEDGPAAGTVELQWDAGPKRFARTRPARWMFPIGLKYPLEIRLTPEDTLRWHPFRWIIRDAKTPPAPLVRIPVDSPDYPDLLGFTRALTAGLFDEVVRRWPGEPVPVRAGDHVSGDVDLSECLRVAVGIWNDDPHDPWFVLDEEATWGVRLVHYTDALLSPPLRVQLTRRDGRGNPIRMNILAGRNYDDATDSVYVVRAMVHELVHTRLLWGHSTDRRHSVWGAAPPLVGAPSVDERKAAQLLRGLPEGLDLKLYRPVSAGG
ncbi:MAG: hypothetical protein ABIK96_09605 [bacterium]